MVNRNRLMMDGASGSKAVSAASACLPALRRLGGRGRELPPQLRGPIEHHYGENVWVTRKGAVRARKNDLGIIPGSHGNPQSYIVQRQGQPGVLP